jgi:hypothetical protein
MRLLTSSLYSLEDPTWAPVLYSKPVHIGYGIFSFLISFSAVAKSKKSIFVLSMVGSQAVYMCTIFYFIIPLKNAGSFGMKFM